MLMHCRSICVLSRDVNLIADTEVALKKIIVDLLENTSRLIGLEMNLDKTETVIPYRRFMPDDRNRKR